MFPYGLIVFDALTIVYFTATAALAATPGIGTVNTVLGVAILLDLAARLWISPNCRRELRRIYTLADLVVVASLLVAPLFADDLAFLRVLRGLRLVHAYHLLRDLRRESLFFRRHEDAILADVNLFVFFHVGDRFGDNANMWELRGYTLIDASIWYTLPYSLRGRDATRPTRIQLAGKNLTDETFFPASGFDNGQRINVGTPRAWFLSVSTVL